MLQVESPARKSFAKQEEITVECLEPFAEVFGAQRSNCARLAGMVALSIVAPNETERAGLLVQLDTYIAFLQKAVETVANGDLDTDVSADDARQVRDFLKSKKKDAAILGSMLDRASTIRAAFKDDETPSYQQVKALEEYARGDLRKSLSAIAVEISDEVQRLKNASNQSGALVKKLIDETLNELEQISLNVRLISLNASVEAARAGEAGKGFGVIASEIQNLAMRAQSSVDTVRAQIADM